MKSLFSVFLLMLPLVSLATTTTPLQHPTHQSEPIETKSTFISEHNGIAVYSTSFSLEGSTYVSLEFRNTTNATVRFLWSAQINGTDAMLNTDGTTQAYLTIPAGGSTYFGQANSSDPLLESSEEMSEKTLRIHIEIQ